MFETSKDLLNIVIAFSALWLTIFICWALYYLLATIKNVKEIVEGFKKRIDEFGNLIKTIKQKSGNLAIPLTVLNESIKQIAPLIKKFKKKHIEKQKSRETKKQKKRKTKK